MPFAAEVHFALIHAYEQANHANTRYFSQWDLTPQQYNVVRILYFGEDEGVRLTDIGGRLLQRVPDVSRLVDRLEDAHLAVRMSDREDRRVVRVALTANGRQLLVDIDADLQAEMERLYSALSGPEQRRLYTLLEKAAAVLAASNDSDHVPAIKEERTR